MRKKLVFLAGAALAAAFLGGCQKRDPSPGDIAGYDAGEQYLSIWVHSIEDTEEGQAYRESVETFNEAYNGRYFADIEFVPRNDSGGGYSRPITSSSPWRSLRRRSGESICPPSLSREPTTESSMHWG